MAADAWTAVAASIASADSDDVAVVAKMRQENFIFKKTKIF